jgi:hypothetical protein
MNISLKKELPRRTFLRGLGASLGLPLLDAMVPAFAAAATTSSKIPARMAFVYFPNGVQMDHWTIKADTDISALPATLPRTLEPLASLREDVTVVGGLTINGGRELGDGPGDHGRAGASYLTNAHPKKTFGKDIQTGISIDQIVAQKIGGQTRYASLELGCEEGIQGGNCDNGYSCAYSNSISWRTPSTPNPPEIRPRAVFERLFGSAEVETDPVRRARRQRYQKSILDSVLEDARSLEGSLGKTDRRKLDEYLFAIREIETRIQKTESQNTRAVPSIAAPSSSIPENFEEHAHLLMDLMTLALQTDSTRVITFLLALEQSNRAYREIGIAESHHGLTHHGGDKEKIEKCIRINQLQMAQFAYLVKKLKATPEGDGTLLDHAMVVYGSGLSRDHDHDDLPTVLAGRGHGAFRPGRLVRFPKETPMANLHVTMAEHMGVPVESFADSTGKLNYLSDLG